MIDDKSLRKVLKEKITLINNYPRTVRKRIEFEMAQTYNVKYGITVDIFNEIISIDDLSYDILYKLMKSIHVVGLSTDENKQFDFSGLDEKKYFTESEINEFNIPYPEEERDTDLVISDWKQMSPNKIKIYTNIDEVIKWRNNRKIRFNPKTQRDLITVKINKSVSKKLDINRNAVEEMKFLMKKGMYYNVCGILNINPEIYEIPYKEGRNLVIPKESNLDIIEGFHNYLAATELKDEYPDFKFDMEYNLMLLTTDEANDLIIQMDKKTHFRPAQIIRNDRLNEVNYVINRLNSNSSFHLFGTLTDDMKYYLNQLLTKLFGYISDRSKSIELVNEIESKLNFIVETESKYSPFSKREYFIYLNLICVCNEMNLDFFDIYSKINLQKIKEDEKTYNPIPVNIKNMALKLKEEISNVL